MIEKLRQSGFASEDLKEGSSSMKRPVVFLLLGPSLVALAVWMVAAAIAGRIDDSFVGICAITSFLLTLPVSSITGLMDGYLARGLPALLRAFLTAAFGMTIAIGLVLALFTLIFSQTVPPEIVNVAIYAGLFLLLPMGVCSLLSNEIDRQGHSIEPACA
ncbi:hypothetical protein [Bradyrhizobium sp. AZCC 1693]|uniref:hypothetical protein n=1 Tax=Bradyrhizobium sp. AZCC 1693 TaxID=3117029 RepID=UPI002FEF6847